jgi:hypothetical protein
MWLTLPSHVSFSRHVTLGPEQRAAILIRHLGSFKTSTSGPRAVLRLLQRELKRCTLQLYMLSRVARYARLSKCELFRVMWMMMAKRKCLQRSQMAEFSSDAR